MKRVIFILFVIALFPMFPFAQSKIHIVQRGETVDAIANFYGVSIESLHKANPNLNSYMYVGMKLNIPTLEEKKNINVNKVDKKTSINSNSSELKYDNGLIIQKYNDKILEKDDFESRRKLGYLEVGYYAESFEAVKETGHYGLGFTMLPWELASRLYAGFYISPFSFNFGLSDVTTDVISLGPALGFYLTENKAITFPLNVDCAVFFVDGDTRTSWGLSFSPTIYLGEKNGIYLGLRYSTCFSDPTIGVWGFRAGIYF